jgi:hypothetical protein
MVAPCDLYFVQLLSLSSLPSSFFFAHQTIPVIIPLILLLFVNFNTSH